MCGCWWTGCGRAAELLDGLRRAVRKGPVTLLTASKEPARSQARVLLDLLKH